MVGQVFEKSPKLFESTIDLLNALLPYLNTVSGKPLEFIIKTLSTNISTQDASIKETFLSYKPFIIEAMSISIQSPILGVRKETVVFLAKCCILWESKPDEDESFSQYQMSSRRLIAAYIAKI